MGSDLISFPYTDASSELAAARARVAGMESELRLALGVEATESWQFLLSRVRGLLPLKKTIRQISDALGCHDTNPSIVLDAVTRMVEVNGRMTSETSSALATERKAHADTQAELQKVDGEIRQAIEDGSGGKFASTARALAHGRHAIVRELAESWFHRGNLIDTLRKRIDEADVDADDSSDVDPDGDDRDPPTAEPVISAIESLTAAMAASGRDWKANPLDAWLYGVIIGWSFNEMCDVAAKHGWPDSLITRLGDLHAAVMGASRYDGGDE